MTDDFPTPEGLEVADGNGRPGDPLYPGDHTIEDRDGHPLSVGAKLQVWLEAYADGHGTETITGEVVVIPAEVTDEEETGDVFAIPAHQAPTEPSRVYRLAADLSTIQHGVVIPRPSYNAGEGVLSVTRHVQTRGSRENKLVEARYLGRQEYWGKNRNL